MGCASWAQRPPAREPGPVAVWHGQPGTAADLTGMRRRLRAALANGVLPAGADGGERLLLAVEELASNGLRHGRPPVQVTITAARSGWLLEVTDAATMRPPIPAVGRDAALGGMGLHLVARLSRAHGWILDADRKTLWASIPYRTPSAPPPARRIRAATARARDLAACLAVTEARIAATLQRLAVDAVIDGRPERARDHRAVAERAQRDAERARLLSLMVPASGPRRLRPARHAAGRPTGAAEADTAAPGPPAR